VIILKIHVVEDKHWQNSVVMKCGSTSLISFLTCSPNRIRFWASSRLSVLPYVRLEWRSRAYVHRALVTATLHPAGTGMSTQPNAFIRATFPLDSVISVCRHTREYATATHVADLSWPEEWYNNSSKNTGHSASGIPSRQTRDSLRGLTPILRRSSRLQFHLQRLKQLRQVLSRR
jgi:hypothetical protein